MQHTHNVFSLITYFLQNIYELEAQAPFLYFTSKSLKKLWEYHISTCYILVIFYEIIS